MRTGPLPNSDNVQTHLKRNVKRSCNTSRINKRSLLKYTKYWQAAESVSSSCCEKNYRLLPK
jgi:hypothetical protein